MSLISNMVFNIFNPGYNKPVSQVSWLFVESRFHSCFVFILFQVIKQLSVSCYTSSFQQQVTAEKIH